MFKRKGGGVKGLLNNVKKNCTFIKEWLPLVSSSNFDLAWSTAFSFAALLLVMATVRNWCITTNCWYKIKLSKILIQSNWFPF